MKSGKCFYTRNMLWITLAVIMMWSGVSSVHGRSLEEIIKTKEIRVCIAPIYPSYAVPADLNCREDCLMTGPVPSQVKAFTETLGNEIAIRFMRVEWDEQFYDKESKTVREASYTPELLSCGKCDLYPTHIVRNEWRLKKLDFVILFQSRMMVIINKSKKKEFNKYKNLGGKIAAVEKDTSYHTWLQEQNKSVYATNPITIRLMRTEKCFQELEDGNVDFTIADSDMALWAVAHHLRNSVVAFPVGPVDEIGWAFRKEDKELQAAVKMFFDKQGPDETSPLNRIWKKEFGLTLIQLNSLIWATP